MPENNLYRVESDSLGTKRVPKYVYYGIQTMRAKENFTITKSPIHSSMIKALALTKKAATMANKETGDIEANIADAMIQACDEIINGEHHDQFITDMIQGGAGTSMNMNINEVISNRGAEILGGELGKYNIIHPNDHANYGQSTNDVVPTSGRIAIINETRRLLSNLKKMHKTLLDKAHRYSGCIKMGRTHLQDAIPISVGQEFGAFASCIERDIKRITHALKELKFINMGATAVGTGLNASLEYMKIIIPTMNEVTGIKFKQSIDLIDGTRNLDPFVWLSSSLKTLAVNLSKNANDIRLMASGPTTGFAEINLPKVQPGSSIMPGKVNPVIPEVVNQISFQVLGNDLTITKAAEAGQLELNVFFPVLLTNILQSIEVLANGVEVFTKKALKGLTVNEKRCIEYVEQSAGVVTALTPYIGYEKASTLAKKAIASKSSIRKVALEDKLLTDEEIAIILDVQNLTSPGISGIEKIGKKL